jgi:uncharacterized Zn finger protein (UPF0148 family)
VPELKIIKQNDFQNGTVARTERGTVLSNWQQANYDNVHRFLFCLEVLVFPMPIRVNCACGHAMNVPDAYAGKSGKCPKCAQAIKIPAASGKSANVAAAPEKATKPKPSAAPAKPAAAGRAALGGAATSPAAKSGSNALDQLLAEAGLTKNASPVCPACKSPIKAGSVLCTACGFHIQSGQTLKAHVSDAEAEQGAYEHKALNEADKNIRKEIADDQAIKFVGWPWWVYLAFVIGLVMVISFGVARQDQDRDENGAPILAAKDTFAGQIQRMPLLAGLAYMSTCVASMVVSMASLVVLVGAFKDKALQGILCIFVPFYVFYYAFSRRKKLGKAPGIMFTWTAIMILMLIATVYCMITMPMLVDEALTWTALYRFRG